MAPALKRQRSPDHIRCRRRHITWGLVKISDQQPRKKSRERGRDSFFPLCIHLRFFSPSKLFGLQDPKLVKSLRERKRKKVQSHLIQKTLRVPKHERYPRQTTSVGQEHKGEKKQLSFCHPQGTTLERPSMMASNTKLYRWKMVKRRQSNSPCFPEHFAGRTTVAVPYLGRHVDNGVGKNCQLLPPDKRDVTERVARHK